MVPAPAPNVTPDLKAQKADRFCNNLSARSFRRGIPSMYDYCSPAGGDQNDNNTNTTLGEMFFDEHKAIRFLIDEDLIKVGQCPKCGAVSDWKEAWDDNCNSGFVCSRAKLIQRCKSPQRHEFSPFKGTFFGLTRLPKHKVLFLIWLWSMRATELHAHIMTGVTRKTIGQIYKFLRETCGAAALSNSEQNKIGGPNVIVEIDESKFGTFSLLIFVY